MANGLSALQICQAMRDGGAAGGRLISVDPFQSTQWDNAARAALARAGLSDLSEVREEPSYLALPRLLHESGLAGKVDLVFVDGMHMFDYTLVDVFMAQMLLRVGGVLVLDDIAHRGVAQAYEYVCSNYAHLSLVRDTGCASVTATFVKTGEDTRAWDHHVPIGLTTGSTSTKRGDGASGGGWHGGGGGAAVVEDDGDGGSAVRRCG